MCEPSYRDGLGTIFVSVKMPSEFASGKGCLGRTTPWALEAKRDLPTFPGLLNQNLTPAHELGQAPVSLLRAAFALQGQQGWTHGLVSQVSS